MAETLRNIIISTLREERIYLFPGELYNAIVQRGYSLDPDKVLQRARELGRKGVLETMKRGFNQTLCYKFAS